MRHSTVLMAVVVALLCGGLAEFAWPQSSPARGTIVVPPSSRPHPGRPRTPLLLFAPEGAPLFQPGPPADAETPASIACIYKLTKQVSGCPINGTHDVPAGGAKVIGIVGVGNTPSLTSDLATFSKTFGLAPADLEVVCNDPAGCPALGYDIEESLDVEWAHAMAPKAKIILVESAANYPSLFAAVGKAGELVSAAGGGEVNVSATYCTPTHCGEDSSELQYDKDFKASGVVYFASSGDDKIVEYPSASPYVVSAGGTTINRDASGDFTGETAWSESGGGPSQYEHRPAFQNIIRKIVGDWRGTPDVSFEGNPASGVAMLDSYAGGWTIGGGTSLASPALTGIFNAAGHFYVSTSEEHRVIYKEYGIKKEYHAWFRDITKGMNNYDCVKGWDFCSGLGSVLTYKGK
jgi:kumamolisin